MVEDYFKILGVHHDASQAEVQKAFRDLAWQCHPDVHPEDKTAKQKFQEIQNAFGVVNDPEKRKTYVARLRSERFLTAVEETYLVPDKVLQKLRRRVARSKKPLRAATVAEHLIKKGHLSHELAQRLLTACSQEIAAPAQPPAKKPGDEPAPAPRAEADEDLQLAPLDDDRWSRYKPYAPKVPSGSLLDEELPPLQADAGGGPLVVAPRRRGWRRLIAPRRRPGRKANVWDSPLLLVGGGILLTLVLLFIVLLFAVTPQTGDEALRLANADYRTGSYSQAIYKYDQYLKEFSNHPGVGLARVNRGLAQLRQVTPRGTTDWSPAFQVAKEVLDEIGREKELKQAQADLSAILLTIAQGLAAQARQSPHPELVEKTRETLELMRKYVPPSPLRSKEIAEIEASLALTEREIAHGDRLN